MNNKNLKTFFNFLLLTFLLIFSASISLYSVYAYREEIDFRMLPNLKYGKTNKDVKILQEILYDLGYFQPEEEDLEFSGEFNVELKNSILEFQKDNNLNLTGAVNIQTYATLKKFSDSQNNFIEKDVSKYDGDFLDFYKKKFDIFDCFLDPVCAHLK